jgi:hypothetical protein
LGAWFLGGHGDIALSLTVVGLATSVLGTLSLLAAMRAAQRRS